MTTAPGIVALVTILASCACLCPGADTQLCDFETPADLGMWEVRNKSAALSDQHVTHGAKSLKISASDYMACFRLPKDWSGHDSLEIDMFVEGEEPVGGSLLVGDEQWQKKDSYWNRHNGRFNLRPGANTVSIPVNGLYRGEGGSRGNDIPGNIDPTAIVRLDLGFTCAKPGSIYIDHMRLTSERPPAGILAFDFGPEDQTLFPGFTGITWNTIHGKDGRKAGLVHTAIDSHRARDDGFPTRLYGDWLEMGNEELEFVVDVPNGRYGAWVVFDDCGYWGGETAHHRKRWIAAEGTQAWAEDRGADGATDFLFRFEAVEPKVGDDPWTTYVQQLFTPKRFACAVTDGAVNLRFGSDAPWSSKVAAVILFPEDKQREAEAWIAEVERRNREEFAARAVCLTKAAALEIPKEAAAEGWWFGFPSLDDTLTAIDAPGLKAGSLTRSAARDQRVSVTFAVRPLVEDASGPGTLACSDLVGAQGTIPSAEVDLRLVAQSFKRGFNDIAYRLEPDTLRPLIGGRLPLERGSTRQCWLTVHVPARTRPGRYAGTVTLVQGSRTKRLPIAIDVLDLALDQVDIPVGFYGATVPREFSAERRGPALRELLTTLRQSGMTTFSGGPDIAFSGMDAQGRPLLDFRDCDGLFAILKECGFTGEIMSYGGPAMVRGLHDQYVIGETGHRWEATTGKPFSELLKLVWGAVRDHGQAAGWPTMAYTFTDEPRVIEVAKAQLELMRAYRQAVPFVRIGGGYSIDWKGTTPLDQAMQEMFSELAWSALNVHAAADLDKARQLKRDVYIYNQGRDRYTFGRYLWSERRKGVTGFLQWHALALHGYQFFDLDGREPDTAMINWTRSGVIPTIGLHRCREGLDDYRFALTLWNAAAMNPAGAAAKDSVAWLEGMASAIGVAQRAPPPGIDGDAFRSECAKRLAAVLSER
ncbi:MAG: hypothetical protein H0W83_08590 [Planctomycetes bacterium]|nr:hypothetical protein [Planctomycetota bacterium]